MFPWMNSGPPRCTMGWWGPSPIRRHWAALDRWADEQTGGLIEKFPLGIDDETLLVLASALTARVRWRTPFEGSPRDGGDEWSWSDDPGPADQQSLRRATSDLSIAAVLDDVVTRVVVEGDGDDYVFDNISDRQSKLIELADLMLVLTGGFGTMYECLEAITKNQIREISKKIIIFNFKIILK